MTMRWSELLLASAVGSVLWLDRFQFLRIMVSRPIVAAPLVGWVLGDLTAGLASGLLFEMLWLARPPVGGYIPPDATLGSVATAAVASAVRVNTGAELTGIVCLTFLALFPVTFLGSRIDVLLRLGLGKLAHRAEGTLARDETLVLSLYFTAALVMGFVVAFLALFLVMLGGSVFVQEVWRILPQQAHRALGFGFFVIPLLGVADVMAGFGRKDDCVVFLVGCAVAVVAGLLIRF